MSSATLLIATRNRAPQLRPALQSIQARNYQGIRILVIDDGSTDNTDAILRQYDDFVDVFKIPRMGGYRQNPGAVLNMGHRLADADIVIEQGGEICHLTDCVTPLLEICRPGTVALARVYHGESKQMTLIREEINAEHYEFPQNFEPDAVKTAGSHWVVPRIGLHNVYLYCGLERPAPFLFLGAIHRRDFEAVGGYDEQRARGNDEDLANRLLAKGARFCFVGRAVAFHLKHGKT